MGEEVRTIHHCMDMVDSFRTRSGTINEWLQQNFISKTTIYGWRENPWYNNSHPDLQGVNGRNIGQMNDTITVNVNEDKKETILIMTGLNIQQALNHCTVVDFPDGKQVMVMKKEE